MTKEIVIEQLINIMSKYDSCSRLCHDKIAEEIYNTFIQKEDPCEKCYDDCGTCKINKIHWSENL